jgi:hypothetical protein
MKVWIPGSITVLAAVSWHEDRKTEIVTFEALTRLAHSESGAFSSSSLQLTNIPRIAEMPGSFFFQFQIAFINFI